MYPSDYQEERNKQKINERRLKRLQKNRSMGADSRSELTTHFRGYLIFPIQFFSEVIGNAYKVAMKLRKPAVARLRTSNCF